MPILRRIVTACLMFEAHIGLIDLQYVTMINPSLPPTWIFILILLSLRNSLLDLVDLGVDGVVGALLGNHDSESLEVSQVLLGITGSKLLGPSGLGPSSDGTGLLKGGLDSLGSGTSSDVNAEISQGQPTEWQLLSLDTVNSLRTVDDNTVAVDDVDNDAGLAAIWPISDKAETSGFNESSEHSTEKLRRNELGWGDMGEEVSRRVDTNHTSARSIWSHIIRNR